MALPAGVSLGTFTSGSGDLSVPWSSHSTGNLGVLIVESANQTIATPSGWTQFPNSPVGQGTPGTAGAVALAAFWKVAESGAEANVTVTDTGDHTCAKIIVVSGADPYQPWDFTAASTSSGTSLSLPTGTTAAANRHIMQFVGTARDANATNTTFSGWANASLASIGEREDKTIDTGIGGGLGISTGDKATAGAIGTTTVTQAVSSNVAMLTIAIRPPSAFNLPPAAIALTDVNINAPRTYIFDLPPAAIEITQVLPTVGYSLAAPGVTLKYSFNLPPCTITLFDTPLGPLTITPISTQIEYYPAPVPFDPKLLPRYIESELLKIHNAVARIAVEKLDV